MSHLGIICPATTGHLNSVLPLGSALKQRGHQVTLFGVPDVESKARIADVDCCILGAAEYPLGAVEKQAAQQGRLSGLKALHFTVKWATKATDMLLREAPSAIGRKGVDALIVDQVSLAGGTIAETMEIPYISFCSCPPMNQEPDIPPYVTPWGYQSHWGSRWRNQLGYNALNALAKPIRQRIDSYRRAKKLPKYRDVNDAYSPLAQISQEPAEFEFPRLQLPSHFYFTGPFHSHISRKSVKFPFEKLTQQFVIYASLGTLQNRQLHLFKLIAEDCAPLDVKLVISLGGAATPEMVMPLPGDPVVVEYAPQIELLKRVSLVITHAGMNTTLETLSHGIPMVAIPIANDQPGVAARIQWTGAGEVIPVRKLTPVRLRTAIERVIADSGYRKNAQRLQTAIQQAGGVTQAIDVIESVINQGSRQAA